jgi:hypothetical protein
MNRSIALLLLLGCSSEKAATPPDRVLATGLPGKAHQALCDSLGRWGVDQISIEHWLHDPKTNKDREPANGSPRLSIFRDTLPFPQFTWGTGDFEVTQLIFPAADGFIARYHVMNHGEEARSVRLLVGGHETNGKTPPLAPSPEPSEKTSAYMAFDLKMDPGMSQFVVLRTPGSGTQDPSDALDDAAATWEKILSIPIAIPEPEAQAAYALDLAGKALGRPGSSEAVEALEHRFVKREGNALRLLGDVARPWLLETIEVKGLKTDFGPLSFRHVGFYNSRTLDLSAGCAPPGGFLLPADPRQKATIDGKEAVITDGVLSIPAGSRTVELSRKF